MSLTSNISSCSLQTNSVPNSYWTQASNLLLAPARYLLGGKDVLYFKTEDGYSILENPSFNKPTERSYLKAIVMVVTSPLSLLGLFMRCVDMTLPKITGTPPKDLEYLQRYLTLSTFLHEADGLKRELTNFSGLQGKEGFYYSTNNIVLKDGEIGTEMILSKSLKLDDDSIVRRIFSTCVYSTKRSVEQNEKSSVSHSARGSELFAKPEYVRYYPTLGRYADQIISLREIKQIKIISNFSEEERNSLNIMKTLKKYNIAFTFEAPQN